MAYTTIDKSSLHFNTKLFTGTGSALSITGVGFAPDLSWVKRRSSARGHTICDILEEEDKYSIYIRKEKAVIPWKDFNKNMAISVEYNLEY